MIRDWTWALSQYWYKAPYHLNPGRASNKALIRPHPNGASQVGETKGGRDRRLTWISLLLTGTQKLIYRRNSQRDRQIYFGWTIWLTDIKTTN